MTDSEALKTENLLAGKKGICNRRLQRKMGRKQLETDLRGDNMLDPTGRFYNIFTGCIMGGAFGDALGFPVEFMQLSEIMEHYGRQGIVRPEFGPNQKMMISDDTQLTLFGMDGLTQGLKLRKSSAADADAEIFLDLAYLDWYATQQSRIRYTQPFTAVYSDHRLRAQRAPGKTTMSALSQQFLAAQGTGQAYDLRRRGTMEAPLNASKGCGAVMRAAPIGLMLNEETQNLRRESVCLTAARAAAITHGHPFAWLSSALLAELIHRMTYRRPADPTLERLIANAVYQVEQEFRGVRELPEFIALMERAMELSADDGAKTGESLARLGKGVTAESTLAVSIYLALHYQNDYFMAVHAAVNQSGDSDTAGSVTGNLLGAWLGDEAVSYQLDCVYGMQGFLEQHLEMYDLLLDTVRRAWHTAILGDA